MRSGASLLVAVLFLGGIALFLALRSALWGIGELQAGTAAVDGRSAILAAESCIEEALLQLRGNQSFTSTTLTVGQGSCTAQITAEGGAVRRIQATGTYGAFTRSLTVRVDLGSPTARILDWREW